MARKSRNKYTTISFFFLIICSGIETDTGAEFSTQSLTKINDNIRVEIIGIKVYQSAGKSLEVSNLTVTVTSPNINPILNILACESTTT